MNGPLWSIVSSATAMCLPNGDHTLTANINHKKEEKFASPHFFKTQKNHIRNLDNQNGNLKKMNEE